MTVRKTSRPPLFAYALLILIPLLFFGIVEGGLRLFHLYDPASTADPFIGLLEGHRIFLPDAARGVYFIDRDRARSFNAQTFPIHKPQGTYRIFCLGGSAAYGYPFGAAVAFSRWLGDACRSLWPERRFEVINAAGMSYGSHRLRALTREILEYEPDLVIVYSGHNEFIEKDFYLQSAASRLVGVRAFLARFHLYNFLKQTLGKLASGTRRGPGRFDEFGLHVERRENVSWTDEERAGVLQKYRENIAAIADRLAGRGVPLLLIAPAPNLGNWRPEHSSLGANLTEEQVAAWSAAYAAGVREQEAGHLPEALASYAQALAIDDHYAESHYRAGQCDAGLGDYAGARREYGLALDRDDIPVRVTSPQRQALHEIASRKRLPFADAWSSLSAVEPHGILGTELFWDYCHPNVRGHQLIAALACSVLARTDLLGPPPPFSADPIGRWPLRSIGMAAPDSFDLRALPAGADGLWWLGNCADRQGNRSAAIAWYRQSLEANPNHPGSLIGLAIARSAEGSHAEAIELTTRALQTYERLNMPPLVTRAHAELGVFYGRAGKMREAAQEFREALRRNPTYPRAHANLARALVMLGDSAEAEKVLRAGLVALPKEPGLHGQLGRMLQQRGRGTEAIEFLAQEVRLSPADADAHDLLGDLYRADGKTDLAIAEWEACLRITPDREPSAIKLANLYVTLQRTPDALRVLRAVAAHRELGAQGRELMHRLEMQRPE